MASVEVVPTSGSRAAERPRPAPAPIDRLSALLGRFRVRAELFHSGTLCDRVRYEALPGRAFLHVLRRGRLLLRHAPGSGLARELVIAEPTVLLYARPVRHEFVHPPRAGADYTCAALAFDGGGRNPIVRALPPLVAVPLARIEGLDATLCLLFAETDRVRCGSRALADRLFEVAFIQLLRWILDHPAEAGIGEGMIAGLADARLARALVGMHQQPERPWTLAALAAEAAMSRSAFALAFRRATGVAPARYLTDWRLTLAGSLLREGRPLKLVAAEVGFAGAASLSKAFRQCYGAGPREWLRQAGLDRSVPARE